MWILAPSEAVYIHICKVAWQTAGGCNVTLAGKAAANTAGGNSSAQQLKQYTSSTEQHETASTLPKTKQ